MLFFLNARLKQRLKRSFLFPPKSVPKMVVINKSLFYFYFKRSHFRNYETKKNRHLFVKVTRFKKFDVTTCFLLYLSLSKKQLFSLEWPFMFQIIIIILGYNYTMLPTQLLVVCLLFLHFTSIAGAKDKDETCKEICKWVLILIFLLFWSNSTIQNLKLILELKYPLYCFLIVFTKPRTFLQMGNISFVFAIVFLIYIFGTKEQITLKPTNFMY